MLLERCITDGIREQTVCKRYGTCIQKDSKGNLNGEGH